MQSLKSWLGYPFLERHPGAQGHAAGLHFANKARNAYRRKDWHAAIQFGEAAMLAYGNDVPSSVRILLRKSRRAQVAENSLRDNMLIYKAVAAPNKVIWVNPDEIKFKVNFSAALNQDDILPGEWDMDRTPIDEVVKIKSVVQHFRDGMAWEETELFRLYSRQLEAGVFVRRGKNIGELKAAYSKSVDELYEKIKREGFLLPDIRGRKENDLPHVHISRDGEILLGNGGNHRIAIVRILKLERIPCVVHARHALWQKHREKIFEYLSKPKPGGRQMTFADHPDLDDLLSPTNTGVSCDLI